MSSVAETTPSSLMPPDDNLASDSDDGFQDHLSDSEDENTLSAQETMALERRMKTVGIRDGLELGKEDTLQEGFDQGFAIAANRSFQFGVLRGALSAAVACGLFQEDVLTQADNCMKRLRTLEMDTHLSEDGKEDTLSSATVTQAQKLLQSIGVDHQVE